jgi:serine/threonine protein kinase
MAELFLATEAGRPEEIVIKRNLPYLSQEQEFVQVFLDEARIAAQLHHPNIITVHELGKLEESIFLAMEHVEGVDLRKILQQEMKRGQAVPYQVAAYVTAQVCAGLFYAHNTKGIDGRPLDLIHRDVSPQNVMVAYDGRVKIVDFGIAKAGAFMEQSKPGVIKGKFLYLSPEQLSQDRLDRRADLFALGTMLYEVTTGRSPFHKSTTEAVIFAIRSEDPPAPSQLKPDYPEGLSRIIMKCLQKDRTRRYQQASEVQRDLEQFLQTIGGLDAVSLGRYTSKLFNAEQESGRGGRDPESTSPERTAPLLNAGRRITREIQGNAQEEDPRTQMARPEDLQRAQQQLRTSQPVVKPPTRRSGSDYPSVGGDEGTRTESASNEVSQKPAPVLGNEARTRQDRRNEPVFDSMVGRRPSPPFDSPAEGEPGEDSTGAYVNHVPLWKNPWVLGASAFLAVAVLGIGVLSLAQSRGGDRRDPSPIQPIVLPPPKPEHPVVAAAPEDAGPATVATPSEPAADAGPATAVVDPLQPVHLTHPPPPPPVRRHSVVEFTAPAGTKITFEKKKLVAGKRYTVPAGNVKVEYQCPGKRTLRAKTVRAPPTDKPQIFALNCSGR